MSFGSSGKKRRDERITRQAHRADIANIDDLTMAEARCSKVDLILSRLSKMLARRGSRKESHLTSSKTMSTLAESERSATHDEVLKKASSALDLEVRAAREVASLLQEDGIRSEDLADIYRDVL